MAGQLDEHFPDFRVGPDQMAPYLVLAGAAQRGGEVAVHDVATGQRWTFAELLASVERTAGALAAAGLEPGEFVVTMLGDQFDGIRAWLAAAFLGAVEVPINPRHRGELLRELLTTARPRVLLADAEVLAELDPEDLAGVPVVVAVGDHPSPAVITLARLEESASAVTRVPAWRPHDIAAVIFTSGTTGPSKGVLLTWCLIYQMVSWVPTNAYGAGDAVYCPLPMFHLAAKSTFTNALARGARFVYRTKFSASAFLADVRDGGCTTANIVGPMLSMVAATPARPDDAENPLRAVVCGPLVPDIENFKARFGTGVVTCYGMTEIGSVLSTDYEHGSWNSCGRVRDGYPWPQVRIVDEQGEDVPAGTAGELIVKPSHRLAFSPGYLDDPQGTAQAWRDGWFHSGDALRVGEDGYFVLVDRYKDAIRRRGENISSFELESVITRHPRVSECATVGVPGAHGDDDIVVFLLADGPEAVDLDELRNWVEARVPPHMRPTGYRVESELPRNATTMRVKKYELRRLADGSAIASTGAGGAGV